MSEDDKIKKFFCGECGRKTNHSICKEHIVTSHAEYDGTSLTEECLIVECRGCENLSFVKRSHFSEDIEFSDHPVTGETIMDKLWDESIYPPVNYRKPPEWFEDVPDEALRKISEEIYKSLQMESHYLAALGARTLIDRLITLVVKDRGNFQKGLDALEKDGKLSPHERGVLKPVIEAGNAAAHRGWAPTTEQIKTILDTVEGLIRRLLVLPTMSEELGRAVPQRANTRGAQTDSARSAPVPASGFAEAKVYTSTLKKLETSPKPLRFLYEQLEAKLKNLGGDVRVRPQKHYIAYRRNQNFACVLIRPQINLLRAHLNLNPDDFSLDGTIMRDARIKSHFGTGDLEVNIKTLEDLDRFADLFAASYANS